MSLAIKHTLITLAIFLVTPIVIVMINWQWQPTSLSQISEYLFWATETAGAPLAILTCLFFSIVFVICLKMKSKKQIIKLVVIFAFAILLGQVVKMAIKSYMAEPRPFVLWVEDNYAVDDQYFYSLPRSERQNIIEQHLYQSPQIPRWLYQHWLNETGYSFPSGHTLFATTWAFLALILLNLKHRYIVISLIVIWAIIIEISRLALGMHHPIDIVSGSILAWGIALLCGYLIRKWQIIAE